MPISPLFFTKTVTLQRPAVGKDSSGGATRSAWAAVGAALPASVQPESAEAVARFAARDLEVTHAVYTEADPGFARGDRLAVSDGRYLAVEGLADAAGAGRLFRWACREVKA